MRIVRSRRVTTPGGAILRGDHGSIVFGEETNSEEGAIVHARPGERASIGRRVTAGHGAMVHGATILDGAVIGVRAVVSESHQSVSQHQQDHDDHDGHCHGPVKESQASGGGRTEPRTSPARHGRRAHRKIDCLFRKCSHVIE
jgi:hypothetical protein